jgi:hypothetical protein
VSRIVLGSWSATQSGASSVGPSGTRWRHKSGRLVSGAEGKLWHLWAPTLIGYPAHGEPDPGYVVSLKPPLKRDGAGRRSGSKPPFHEAAHGAGRNERAERRWKLLGNEGSGAAREAEHDTTGGIAFSPLYIRGITLPCKGSVAVLQHSPLFTEHPPKPQLTL